MEESCSRCKGKGHILVDGKKDICESCGGYGTNSWIGNVMGKPDRPPILEVVEKICEPFTWEIKDEKTISSLNLALEGALKETNWVIEVDGFTEEGFNLKGRPRKNA